MANATPELRTIDKWFAGLIALVLLVSLVGAYGTFSKDYAPTFKPIIENQVTIGADVLETYTIVKEVPGETIIEEPEDYVVLNDLYGDDLIDYNKCGILATWAKGLDLADEYDDELMAALVLADDDDLEKYEFTLDLEDCKYATIVEDGKDLGVTIEGDIKWETKDDHGKIGINVVGTVDENSGLDDEEVVFL